MDNEYQAYWDGDREKGVDVIYDTRLIRDYAGMEIDDAEAERIIDALLDGGMNANYRSNALNGMFLDDFQWSTGLEFADGISGGYMLGFSWGDCEPHMTVLVEWDSSRIEEAGIEGRGSMVECLRVGVEALRDFIDDMVGEAVSD